MTTLSSFGQSCADSVNVYFSVGHRDFNPSLSNNREVMNDFINKVKAAAADDDIERIVVYGYASPDGKPLANERLARNRCATIAQYIAAKAGVNPQLIEKRPEGIGWNRLRDLVDATPDVPCRQQVLDILDNTPIWVYDDHGRVVDGRKKQLMNLAGGRPWRWMYQHLYPELRNAVAISLYCRPAVVPEDADTTTAIELSSIDNDFTTITDSTAIGAPTAIVEPTDSTACDLEMYDTTAGDIPSLIPDSEGMSLSDTYEPFHRFALKTNMLYYGILLPNLELEWLIDRNWSVAVEGNLASWGSYEHLKSYRITLLDAEGRRWIKPHAPWHGAYVGVMAGGAWYDLENGGTGHYGWTMASGLSVGYMWPITRTLSLEAEIAAGYAYIRYKDYEPIEGHHVYLRTKEMNYFGPLKLKFSIAWRFLDVNKPRHTNKAL